MVARHHDRDSSLDLAIALADQAYWQGRFVDARDILEAVSDYVDDPSDDRSCEALAALGSVQWWMGGVDVARKTLARSVECERRVGAQWAMSRTAFIASILEAVYGDFEAADAYIEEAAAAQEATGRPGLEWIHYGRAFIAMLRGDFALSAVEHDAAIVVGEAAGNVGMLAITKANRARIFALLGDAGPAMTLAHDAIAIAGTLPPGITLASVMGTVGSTAIIAGCPVEARAWTRRNLEVLRDTGGRIIVGEALGIAALCRPEADPTLLAIVLAAATRIGDQDGDFGVRMHVAAVEALRATTEAKLGPDAYAAAWSTGTHIDVDDAIDLALSLPDG